MGYLAAATWVQQAKNNAYLGQTGWVLPPSTTCGGFNCKASPLGQLFYLSLGRTQGQSIATVPDTVLQGFKNLQPYLYWACPPPGQAGPCTTSPANGMQWSFAFGNGFQGTDLAANNLFVMVYSPNTAPPRPPQCHTPITCCVMHGGTWAGGHCV